MLLAISITGCTPVGSNISTIPNIEHAGVDFRLAEVDSALVMSYRTARREALIRHTAAEPLVRVAPLHRPLKLAAYDLCHEGGKGRDFGLYFRSMNDTQPFVVFVVPGSAADSAGIRPGDEIVRFSAAPIRTGHRGGEDVSEALASYSGNAPTPVVDGRSQVSLMIVREGEQLQLRVRPHDVCNYNVSVFHHTALHAFTDGDHIHVSDRLLDMVQNDRELQFVLAHELAHGAANHVGRLVRRATVGTIFGTVFDVMVESLVGGAGNAFSTLGRQVAVRSYGAGFERDADYLAMYILARAGVALDGIEDLWLRLDTQSDFAATGWSHPGYDERYARLVATRNEIERKIARGEPLVPNTRRSRGEGVPLLSASDGGGRSESRHSLYRLMHFATVGHRQP